MTRVTSLALVLFALSGILPAAAQDSGGLRFNNPSDRALTTLDQIEANRGCRQSVTSVTVGVNKAFGSGSSAQQRLSTQNTAGGPTGCRPLVSTQAVVGANLALGGRSNAGQTISAQGPRGLLSTNTFTRGSNLGFGAQSNAMQRLNNITTGH